MPMVVLHARVPVKPDAGQRWRSLADTIAGPSRAEDACHSYRMYEDIETPGNFIFVEEWENLDGLYRHFQTPHFAAFLGALPQVLAGPPDGSVYEVTSTLTLNDALAAAGVSA
jgi:quinol monooxygenase YgiN